MIYKGEYVFRYVFENVPNPDSFFLEINGERLDCIYLPQFSATRVYCMGNSPYKVPIQVRMGWENGDHTEEIVVDPELIERLNREYIFPIGQAPPPPTPTPSNKVEGGGGDIYYP